MFLSFDLVATYARFPPLAVHVPGAFPSSVPAGCSCLLEFIQMRGDVLLSSELLHALFLVLEADFLILLTTVSQPGLTAFRILHARAESWPYPS